MAKKLTHRQQEFLSRFLDLYKEFDQSIHYSTIAERLGIGRVTAYEMLRLLEKKGFVIAEYHLPAKDRGPGRSTVLFKPTQQSYNILSQLRFSSSADKNWDTVKQQIIEKVRQGKVDGYKTLLSELFNRISDQTSPLIYLSDMVTLIILTLESLKDSAESSGLVKRLQSIGLPGEIGLSALAGIGAALSLMERANRKTTSFILDQSGKFQTMISQLSKENHRLLVDFVREVAKIVNT